VHLAKTGLEKPSDILVDQIRTIDNQRLIKRLGKLNKKQVEALKRNIRIVLDV
jgi:mRNA interferase MazF